MGMFSESKSSSNSSSQVGYSYDVFLSFRGEDTRKNFTDHLYNALVQAGIHTFRDDDELFRGEEISQQLLKAIEESRISIVKRSFAEAFEVHEEHLKEEIEKVNKWRRALKEASNLSGYPLKDTTNGKDKMAMEEYCGEELELYLEMRNDDRNGSKVKEIGVHVIVERADSFEESEWKWKWDHDVEKMQGTTSSSADVEEGNEIGSQTGRDILIPKLYHGLHQPLLGSVASSTYEQWITYLLKELPAWDIFFANLWLLRI
ncbi:unnamed protein product [Dovyalis caffra]|uniref:TIR domain-containing protein n=1 Tax=Dovyalis caffra TaxID=77055 RepID=A0AAV1RR62_9ROSI|nr:unnamed protein product [Dovyalis caffra]